MITCYLGPSCALFNRIARIRREPVGPHKFHGNTVSKNRSLHSIRGWRMHHGSCIARGGVPLGPSRCKSHGQHLSAQVEWANLILANRFLLHFHFVDKPPEIFPARCFFDRSYDAQFFVGKVRKPKSRFGHRCPLCWPRDGKTFSIFWASKALRSELYSWGWQQIVNAICTERGIHSECLSSLLFLAIVTMPTTITTVPPILNDNPIRKAVCSKKRDPTGKKPAILYLRNHLKEQKSPGRCQISGF